jgi:hypothetical protein
MIFKVQRPLDEPKAEWLVYSQGRPKLYFVDPKDIPVNVHIAMGRDPKAYFRGSQSGNTITLDERIDDQPW